MKRDWERKFSLPQGANRHVGKAMHDYGMLEESDKVLVAVSGGVDSLVLSWLLKDWKKKAPITYSLTFVYIENSYWQDAGATEPPSEKISRELKKIDLELLIEKSIVAEQHLSCFSCAKARRKQLFELARNRGFTKIALGHHKGDLVETFFLNALYSGNISTMVPKQSLFEGRLHLIRPMAYLEKKEIQHIAKELGLQAVKNYCPFADHTRREKVREMLQSIYTDIPGAKKSVFAAMGNVRHDYLL